MIRTLKEWTFDHYHYLFGVDDLAAATIISGVVAAVASIGSSIMQNKANSDAVEATNEQNKELTERAWERDDMQLQRARQDAEKAGFSPLAALSSNLTNTSPATMQAPQYDFSGVSEGVSKLGDTPKNAILAKQQSKMMREELKQAKYQNRSMMLDNMLKSANFRNNVLKNGAETMKLLKELRGMDLTNAQTASILVANGFTQEQAEKLSGIANIPANKTVQSSILNTDASTGVLNKQKSYIEAQKNYTNLRNSIDSASFKEWNTDAARLARLMTNNLAQSLGEYESYLNNTRVKTLKERQIFSIPVSVDSDGKIVYNDKHCTYAEYLVYWEDFVKRSQSYFNEPTNLERSKVLLDSLWNGVNSISPFKMPTK